MIKKLYQLWLLIIFLPMSCTGNKDIQKTKENGQMENERFYYEVSCSGPTLGPGKYVSVNFIGDSGGFSVFGNESIGVGMGKGYDGVVKDRSRKYYLPKAVEATWVSWTDRKVYNVASLIPYDTILSLFRNGGEPCIPSTEDVPIDKTSHVVECLDLCFLPGGKVILYVKAAAKTILLDWSAIGTEVTDDEILSNVYGRWGLDNMDDYYDMFYSDEYSDYETWRNYMRKHGSVAPLLERYLQRFNYTLNFEFEDKDTYIYSVDSEFTNGELHWDTPKYYEAFRMPSRLKESTIEWNTKDSHYTCFMYFNEKEILKVFDEAYGEDRTQKGELKIKVCKYNNLFDISLNVGEKSIKLEKTAIRVFLDPIENPNGKGTLVYKNYEGDHTNFFADDDEYVGE
ncbi:MAG: DUF2931 family protein [Paludibacteraceae bacterium]|nr:DUF2931 family protein [Paludibacteraceae bacterium]